jgi:ferredoxin-NADP reductase
VTFALDVPDWPGHRAGQHVDIRLTSEDGYQAQRSYSIATAPEDPVLELTVDRVDDGEVSPYLTQEVRPGDQFELRGPTGGYFTWEADQQGTLFMLAGGSGLVPIRSMLRHRAAAGGRADATLLLSARTPGDVLYAAELDAGMRDGVGVHITFTREPPPNWDGYARRVDREMVAQVAPDPGAPANVYVCGPTPFVESVADLLVEIGFEPAAIHTERFGPTGGT